MKQYLLILSLFTATILFSSCKDVQCPAFGTEDKVNWLPQSVDDEIVFYKEGSSENLVFLVKENYNSTAYKHDVGNSWPNKGHDCKVEGHISAIDSSINMSYHINIGSEFYQQNENYRELHYRIGDFNNSFKLFPLLEVQNLNDNEKMLRDSIKSQLSLAGKLYENVIIQTRNTDSISPANFQVNKVYLAAGHGIIGFVDGEGNLYHR